MSAIRSFLSLCHLPAAETERDRQRILYLWVQVTISEESVWIEPFRLRKVYWVVKHRPELLVSSCVSPLIVILYLPNVLSIVSCIVL